MASAAQRRGMVGVDREDLIVTRQGLLAASEIVQDAAAIHQCTEEFGRHRERPVVARQRLREALDALEHDPPVVERRAVTRIDRQGPIIGRECRVRLPAPILHVRKQIQRVEIVGAAIHDGLAVPLGVVELPGPVTRDGILKRVAAGWDQLTH